MSQDCVFCRIVAGTLPSEKICEDGRVVAFMDINPANPGHALVVSKDHATNLMTVSADSLAAVTAMAQRVACAVDTVLSPDGITLIQANGAGAAQSVPHFHVHVLPRVMGDELEMNWTLVRGNMTEIREVADRLRAALDGSA